MKKRFFSLALALVMAVSLSLPALAAEEQGISVQLNGQDLAFTDAAPIMEDGRTFLPVNAVFTAMGAAVSYDEATRTVTAVRDGTALAMTIGKAEATVTVGDMSVPLAMDTAPFIRNDRTYVPVRFAASAFGCQVGWDQDDRTVILVDTVKMAQTLMGEYQFTRLEKLQDYFETWNSGSWSLDGTLKGGVAMTADGAFGALADGKDLVSLDGVMKGLVSGRSKGQISMNVNVDMTVLMELLCAVQGTTIKDAGIPEDQLKQSVGMEVRADLESGMVYMKPDDAYCAMLGVPAGTWLSIDISDILSGMGGMGFSPAQLQGLAQTVALDNRDASYASAQAALRAVLAAFSDDGFKKTDSGYAAALALSENGVTANITLTLLTNAKDEVVGYKVGADAAVDLSGLVAAMGGEATAQLDAMGIDLSGLAIRLNAGMGEAGKTDISMTIALGNLGSMDISGSVQYAATDKAPEAGLPAGVTPVDFYALVQSAAAA